jgi:hypothetical protein
MEKTFMPNFTKQDGAVIVHVIGLKMISLKFWYGWAPLMSRLRPKDTSMYVA